ncbi:hypothetical protein BDB00DRAFT_942242 [Zychaea mexicana]|uniref:uncharacterized protein n=1 Tax=Zychaea mexicana TaxID=64656 RepID=UPI0022FDDD2F|nr:uncharacterized protein BDB00DRAFT_942242 [Zychaea mexicana]KAI9488562.1 hypothetical protein BDB00DRAFT_942242 [Zychaea mexicana]
MTFEGYEEIARYIQQERKPSFKKFVEGNVVSLANWSLKLPTASSSTIHGFWFEKYCKVSMDVFKDLKNMLDKCGEAALNIIGDVSGSVASQVSKSIVSADGSSPLCSPDDSTNDHNAPGDTSDASIHHHNTNYNPDAPDNTSGSSIHHHDTNHSPDAPDNTSYASTHDYDTNHNSDAPGNTSDNSIEYLDLHCYGVKKLRGTFDEQDKCNVESKLTNGSSSNEKITNHIIKLLCQSNLTPTDQETIKLLLSNIINTLDENIYATMENILTSKQLDILCNDDTKSEQLFRLDFVNLALLDKIIDNSGTDINMHDYLVVKWWLKQPGWQWVKTTMTRQVGLGERSTYYSS